MRAVLRLIVVGVLLLGSATSLYAQGPNQGGRRERPYQGLFGGGPFGTDQSLTLNGSVGGGYDSNVLASDSFNFGSAGSKAGVNSQVALANGGVSYAFRRQRVSLFGSATTSAEYYRELETPLVQRHSLGFGASWLLTPRTTLTGNIDVRFDPFYSLLPGVPNGIPLEAGAPEVPTADTSATALHEQHRTLTSSLKLTHAFTRRVSVEGDASVYQTSSESQEFDLTSRELGARLRWELTRDLGLRLGYRRTEATFAASAENPESTSDTSTIDAGVDYHKTLSLTRRTTLGFGTGFASASHDGETTYSLVGNVSLTHEIGRTWLAATGYGRDVQFLDVLRLPVFTDSVFVTLNGMIGSKLRAHTGATYQHGDPVSGDDGDDDSYHSGQGTASLSYNLTRHLATSLSYSYFWYDFSQTVEGSRLPQKTNRHSVRAVLNVWAPVFQRPRRPNASR